MAKQNFLQQLKNHLHFDSNLIFIFILTFVILIIFFSAIDTFYWRDFDVIIL